MVRAAPARHRRGPTTGLQPGELIRDLRAIVGPDHVLTDDDVRAPYEVDWTGQFRGRSLAVVRPADAQETRQVLQCGARVCVQGGNTGLVGGSVPDDAGDAIVLSTRRLNTIELHGDQVTVGAGVTLGDLQRALAPTPYEVAVDLAARDSATIGGMVATNAGGMRVLRYGTMRRQVVGIEAVLAADTPTIVEHLLGLDKDNTGYDLAGLLCGSEGTLGIITRIRLRLVRRDHERVSALIPYRSLDAMVAGFEEIHGRATLDAAEYMVRAGVDLVSATFGVTDPLDKAEAYLLIEASELPNLPDDAVVAFTKTQRDALWALRELHTEALARAGPPAKFDVTLPRAAIAPFIATIVRQVDGTCHHFGHLGDGNVHLNILGSDHDDETVYTAVRDYGGSISAEHGIGRLKRPWLHLSRTPAELAAMTAIKRALDPQAILNPGVLLPDL